MRELVPTYRSLLVEYDLAVTDLDSIAAQLRSLIDSLEQGGDRAVDRSVTTYRIPVAYGGDSGPDLDTVAAHAGITADRVIDIHSGTAYRVYMVGFAPGFPYLGGMDSAIACPRMKTPRVRVPAGSVGIAESQTGVYPNASPGGWQLIGRTPVRLFDPAADPPAVIRPGGYVRFASISESEFDEIARAVEAGEYAVEVSENAG